MPLGTPTLAASIPEPQSASHHFESEWFVTQNAAFSVKRSFSPKPSILELAGLSLLLVFVLADETLRLACMLAASALLAMARLLGVAGAAARAPRWSCPRGRQLFLELLGIAFCALGAALAAVGLGEENDSWVMSLILASAAQFRQPGRHGLQWNSFPLQGIHRRVRAGIVGLLASSFAWSFACLLLGWLFFGSSACGALGTWLITGAFVFSSVELQGILMQDCTSVVLARGPLPTQELLEALCHPLGNHGPGLARWAALTSLAQAVAFEHKGHRFQSQLYSSPQVPLLAAEVFGFSGVVMPSPTSSTPWTAPAKPLKAPVAENRGLFAVYLQSALQVLREFSVRVQCLVASSWRRGPKALTAFQLQVLEADVVELAPLMRIAAAGLAGWICLSRDLDERGVVQREEALSKVIYELCGSLRALERAMSLRGFVDLSHSTACALSGAQEEANLGLWVARRLRLDIVVFTGLFQSCAALFVHDALTA
ncbi:unnamed protein product [Symbiodinium sp. CCMP2592]|nr:unnamed protein product [Symbiodinium sp. CCMP2592]